jgi:hypothetical protein
MPGGILKVFIILLYENPAIIPTQVSLSPAQSTLGPLVWEEIENEQTVHMPNIG